MAKRTAAYCRVSTLDQSTGLESQVRVIKTYCEQNGITNVEFFCDEGISGTKSSRPALTLSESDKTKRPQRALGFA